MGFEASSRLQMRGADLKMLLQSDSRLVVEIGCGVGLHPIQYSSEFKEKNIVAIERTADKFARFAGRMDRHPELHQNLCAVHADAIHFLDRNFQKNSIDEVWILYPNPENKKTSRRWFQTPFMNRLTQLMKPNSELYFATNLKDYADETLELATRYHLNLISSRKINSATHPEWKARTHFEKKYLARGESIFDLKFKFEPTGALK